METKIGYNVQWNTYKHINPSFWTMEEKTGMIKRLKIRN